MVRPGAWVGPPYLLIQGKAKIVALWPHALTPPAHWPDSPTTRSSPPPLSHHALCLRELCGDRTCRHASQRISQPTTNHAPRIASTGSLHGFKLRLHSSHHESDNRLVSAALPVCSARRPPSFSLCVLALTLDELA